MAKLIGVATWNFSEGSLCERIERFVGIGCNAISLSDLAAFAGLAASMCYNNPDTVQRQR